jgi:hypothetical protein
MNRDYVTPLFWFVDRAVSVSEMAPNYEQRQTVELVLIFGGAYQLSKRGAKMINSGGR